MAVVALQQIERTSPSLWTHMRVCGLRAAFASTAQSDQWILHDPRLWLGSAFHAVMQTSRAGRSEKPEEVWDAEIERATQSALAHQFDRRFSEPKRWPSYFLVRQRCLSIASQIGTAPASASDRPPAPSLAPAVRGAERRFQARNGKLVGKPDYYDGSTITEYKSNLPDSRWPNALEILESFRRQLRIYAAIIAEATGRWPATARIISASGQTLDMPVSQDECNREADEAVNALNLLNQNLVSGATAEAIATPAPGDCADCSYRIICPAFWKALNAHGLSQMKATALEGVLTTLDDGQDGDLYSAEIQATASSPSVNGTQRIVLRRSMHGSLEPMTVGSHLRAIDLVLRPDGRLRADLETVVVPLSSVPAIRFSADSNSGGATLIGSSPSPAA